MKCLHCNKPVPSEGRRDRKYCRDSCRVEAYRQRKRTGEPPPASWQHPALHSDTPLLQAAAVRARDISDAHGWDRHTRLWVLDGLTELLDGRPADHHVLMTEVLAIQNERVPRTRLLEVINDMDLLDNDVELPIHQWIKQSVNAFPPGFREPIKKWLTSLCCGGKRERPRSKELMQRYFGAVRPFIYDWSQQYGTLREVTRSDVQLVLDPLQGFQLQNAVVALRSLFRFAKKTGIVFINPATHLRAPKPAFNPLPLTDAEIRAVEQVAQASPEIKLVVALAVEHGARIGAIRPLTFEDVDLPNRRIVLAGHTQRLGDLSQQAMLTWLQHRRVKWPHSPNRHILITGRSAPETRPVSRSYFRKGLWPKGFKFDPIRQDRILHEALTASPDPLHLSMIFGITHATAMRYVRSAQALLAADDELDTKDDQ